jgi:hypothetical protein
MAYHSPPGETPSPEAALAEAEAAGTRERPQTHLPPDPVPEPGWTWRPAHQVLQMATRQALQWMTTLMCFNPVIALSFCK